MSAPSAAATRYAQALLNLCTAEAKTEPVARQLSALSQAWLETDALRRVFEDPSFSPSERSSVLDALCERMHLDGSVRNLLGLLSDRRRLGILPQIVDAYHELSEDQSGSLRAEVITAVPMPEAYFAELQRALEAVTGKRVRVVHREDPAIIGGVVTRLGDRVYDGSIQSQLGELREQLLAPQ